MAGDREWPPIYNSSTTGIGVAGVGIGISGNKIVWYWRWDVFGGGLMVVNTTFEVPRWRRWLTRIFLGSVWTRLEDGK